MRIFQRGDKIIPCGRFFLGEQIPDQLAALAKQLLDRGCDMFGLDLGEARQTGEVE
jgi:hypothetical protein